MNLKSCAGRPMHKKEHGAYHQTLLIMRLTGLLIIIFCFNVTASVLAQQITLSIKDQPLEKAFDAIKKQCGYQFFYNDHLLDNTNKVSINVKNASLQSALDECFKNQPVTYEIIGKSIVVKLKLSQKKTKITPPLGITIRGMVTDTVSKPIQGAVIKIKGTNTATVTKQDGSFEIKDVPIKAVLLISMIGYKTEFIPVSDIPDSYLRVSLRLNVTSLGQVSIVSTGYQKLPKERATGSFEQISNSLLNRSVSMNFTDHIKNLNAGIFYNNDASSTEPIIVRGRSTIYSNTAPLIVLDNFPYDGDIANINPSDIESVTILKDAAAASIWGTRAGNGVIVITTKRGTTSKPTVTFNNSVSIKQRPNVVGMPVINSADFIDLEKTLFANGNYSDEENNEKFGNGHPPFTPVIELLKGVRDGTVSSADANKQIDAMKGFNARKDIQKYLYRNSVVQQHSLGISGNADKTNYYFSAGWDKNADNLVGKDLNRISLRSQETFKISSWLSIDAGLNYVQNNSASGNNPGYFLNNGGGKGLYPYARLVDDKGNPVNLIQNYNTAFIQKAETAGLQDWNYNPINDIGSTKNLLKTTDIVANAGVNVSIFNDLNLELKYQYENQQTRGNTNFNAESFFARNVENQFAQVAGDGTISYPIPQGGIIDVNNSELTSHQGRAQLNYHTKLKEKHEITAIAGWEIKNIRVANNTNRFYGFDKNSSSVNNIIDYSTQYTQYDNNNNSYNITNYDGVTGTLNRYLSYYANASYVYDSRYVLSGSAREDASNLFGVKTNQKSVPLWSSGIAWIINKESFYNVSWLPELKLRATYGYQGNIYNQASAYATATYDVSLNSGLPDATLKNPPNALLRWEKNGTLNLGVDFGARNSILSGSIEYYHKNSKDLMGYAPVDPTTGVAVLIGTTNFFGNVASMATKGLDFTLNANIVKGYFRWNSTYFLSYASTKITGYSMPASPIGSDYLSLGSVNPVVGNPVYALYSYKWGGLDPTNGNPQGYLHGKLSSDYSSIIAQTPLDSMVYKGPSEPTIFGSWRNTFSYKNVSLSFNISYKFNYYFRVPSINYTSLYSTWTGSSDYSKRWQKQGDEKTTQVPSMVYPADPSRDELYTFSDILVQKGDHIRLEDITLSYSINKTGWRRMPFQQIKLYGYASNLGLLWKANKSGLDPDYINYPNPGKNFAIGINLIF